MKGAQEILIQNLIRIRKSKNLSQAKLAELSELSSGLIGDIETGRRNPTLTTIEKICHALNMPPSELFYDVESALLEDSKNKQSLLKQEIFLLIDEYLKQKGLD